MLTSLELFGFKSFADRTLFEFSPGITCVVGPNGSGKSNVVDAIKWILGDQSPKSLRGKEMADVIFNGASGRKPSGFSEATLTFDNSAGLFPLPEPEVRVGRRLYRSGDSEYLLNGAVVRLKDVRDLFLGTGAGTAAYSIIEQGRVDQILQANPTTRRVVFEEAAGISRYKSRKIDAERKLEKVAQNLLRLTDIVDEVETQLAATRSQASKAARYRELAQELQTLWAGLAADDYRVLSRELEDRRQDDARHAAILAELAVELARIESERAGAESELAALETALRREERQVANIREQLAARESTIRHQAARDAELTAEVDRLRSDRRLLTAQATSVARDLQETTSRLEEFEQRVAQQRAALQDRTAHCEQLQTQLTGLESAQSHARQCREETREHLAANDRQTHTLRAQRETLERTLSATAEHLALLEQRLGAAEQELRDRWQTAEEADAVTQTARQAVDAAQQQRQGLLEEQARLEQTLAQLRERRSAAVARIHVLDDLERRQEGISLGVQEILRRAHDSPCPPWNEVFGSVSDLVQVSLEHAPLVEVALGSRSQLIVVRRRQPIIDYLNRQAVPIAGRVGFLELGQLPRGYGGQDVQGTLDLLGRTGVVCRADELLSEIDEVEGLAAQLLSDTWIVESLDVAVTLHATRPGTRFVTLQGELVEADGAVYAGSIPNTTALVSRRSELRDLKHSVVRIDQSLDQAERRSLQLAAELAASEQVVLAAETQLREARQRLADARAAVETQRRDVERLQADGTQLTDQQLQQESLRDQLDRELAAALVDRERLQHRLQEHDDILSAGAERVQGISGDLARLREELNLQQLELAKHEERLAGLHDVLARLAADQRQRIDRLQESDRRLRDALSARRQTRFTILQTRSQLDLDFLLLEELRRSVVRLAAEHRRCRLRSAALAREEDERHQRRRQALDARHQTDIRIRDLERHLAALEERCQEEFQRPLVTFVQQGASAFQTWLQEHYPDAVFPTDAAGAPGATRPGELAPDPDDPESPDDAELPDAEQRPAQVHAAPHPVADAWDNLYAQAPVPFAEVRPELEEQVQRLRRKIKLLGSVNTDALLELDDLETRFTTLSAQLQDLQAAKTALEEIIRRINKESRRIFLETFEAIRSNFRELFRKVFGGGEGDIILEDADNVLECGIDIVARPPGKELRSITLLSGGEKTMTAIALLFAMFRSKPSPYCILDEVDAALDEANVDRYVSIVKEFAVDTQFVIITHRKRTMTAANVLWGVTMEQAGVSKRMSVRFEDVGEDGNFSSRTAA